MTEQPGGMSYWRSVAVVDNENMLVPHVLQQAEYVEGQPIDEHRLVPVTDLDGVE